MEIKIKFGFASLIIILFQSTLKISGVILTNSLALLSETLDTITDIGFVSLTIYCLFHSSKPPDYEHMYGHAKIEPIGALLQGIILINLYGLLIFFTIQIFIEGTFLPSNPDIGLIITIISFSVNLIFSRILIWQGRRRMSLILEIQGLNLFQDSIRSIFIFVNFLFVIFGILFTDPLFSIALSLWIILSALKLSKKSIKEISDTNPINYQDIEEIRLKIFNLEHVKAVEDLRIRSIGKELFLEVSLLVEDHISLIHAHEINIAINEMAKNFFPNYDLKCIIEMNPVAGEGSLIEKIINLVPSMILEFLGIIDVKDYALFTLKEENYLSITLVIDDKLTLNKAHELSSEFEKVLKNRVPFLTRITTHIEAKPLVRQYSFIQIAQLEINSQKIQEIKELIESILKDCPYVKGYHGFEFFTTGENYILELHVFFEGLLNISLVHGYLTNLEQKIRNNIKIKNLQDIILHSEPLSGRTDGIIF